MNVLIVPEDFRKDQYILKPIFERLFRRLGRRTARIRICQDPLLGGVDQALRLERLSDIVDRYGSMIDLFILCVDRDGNVHRRQRLDRIERKISGPMTFFAENAWEELETWVLAGIDLPPGWRWSPIRTEVHVKEVYFDRLVELRDLGDFPGGGRQPLAEEASRRVSAIRTKCREDFDTLARRIEGWLAADRLG
ncbi:MAG: hypothetical protein F4Z72_14460 [Gemmatimonadales bacterium]|nr:hypothetical protein [Candidatus Palauibacter irciniicola]MYC17450.1 hypothetical protein [Gemmatimonadales bacterium]